MSEQNRGRPRNEKARAAALSAARELLLSEGYEGLSLDQVAARAGVGKQSLYRWWGSKSELITQTVLDGFVPVRAFPVPTTADVALDLRSIVDSLVASMSHEDNAPLIRALVVVAATDRDAATVLWDRFTGPARHAVAERLGAAVDEGRLRVGFSTSVAAEAIIGSVLFLVLARQQMPPSYADDLVNLLLRGMGIDEESPTVWARANPTQ